MIKRLDAKLAFCISYIHPMWKLSTKSRRSKKNTYPKKKRSSDFAANCAGKISLDLPEDST